MAPVPPNPVSLPPAAVPPPSTTPLPVVALSLRALTFIFVLVSVVVIGTTSLGGDKFSYFSAYSYMFSCGVIGMIYTFLQIGFTIYNVSTGNQFVGEVSALVDFYGDKALSYLLATGAAAGFGLTVDLHRRNSSRFDDVFNKANASASLLLIGFMFSAVSSVVSSFSLPKKSPGEIQHVV